MEMTVGLEGVVHQEEIVETGRGATGDVMLGKGKRVLLPEVSLHHSEVSVEDLDAAAVLLLVKPVNDQWFDSIASWPSSYDMQRPSRHSLRHVIDKAKQSSIHMLRLKTHGRSFFPS